MRTSSNHSNLINTVLWHGDAVQQQSLSRELNRAAKEEHWSRCLAWLVALVGLACLYGVTFSAGDKRPAPGMSWVLFTEVVHSLGIASLLCLSLVVAVWLRYRGVLHRLREEARRVVLRTLDSGRRRSARDRVRPRKDFLQLLPTLR